MKKWMVTGVFICCMLTLFLSGCATPPEETIEEPIEQVQPVEPVVVEPEPVELPKPVEPVVDLTAENNALIAEGAAARELAIAAGAERYLPDELLIIDIAAREAQVVYEDGGDSVVFNEIASDVVYQYMALEQAALGSAMQQRIDELGFENYNVEQYAIGVEAALKTEELFSSGAIGKDLYEQAKKSADAYRLVLKAGFLALAQTERDKFLQIKEKADAIKAGIADKEGYANAVAFFSQASAHLLEEEHEGAYNNFVISNTSMTKVHEDVSKKRAAAEEAMARAKRRTEEASEAAAKADTIVPLGDVEALNAIETANTDTVQENE